MKMIFQNVQTYYITSDRDGVVPRYVRYDVFKVDDESYISLVFDDLQRGISPPHNIVLIDKLTITQTQYRDKYQIGVSNTVKLHMPPTFEGYVSEYLQDHRNKLD